MCKLLIELFIQGGKIHPHFGLPTFVTTVQLGGSLAGKHRMIELWNRAEEYALISKLASSDAIKTTHLRMAVRFLNIRRLTRRSDARLQGPTHLRRTIKSFALMSSKQTPSRRAVR
jgi:hypothetical protein